MLNFVDITENIVFQDRTGAPDYLFGIQGAKTTEPLDFQIETNEAATSFYAIRVDDRH